MRGEENPTPKREYAWQDGFAGSGNQNDELSMIKDIAGTDNLGEATSLRIVVNSRNATISHLGRNLPNLIELNLSMSVMESIRDIGTGFHLLQASQTSCIQLQPCILSHENDLILLQVLWVPRCGLDSFDGISALPSLRELYASYNDIADLLPLSDCPDLEVIDIECNKVSDLDALEVLSSSCSSLQSLNLTGCPVTNLEGYRELVRMAIPTIISLDDAPINTGNATQTDGTCRVSTSLPPPFLPPKLSLFEDEIHLVQQGIKHARVGVDSHEFRELEIAIMVASSPAANPPHPPHIPHPPLGVDDDTSTSNESTNQLTLEQLTAVASSSILPASASSWMRCSQQGSLPGMASLAQQQQQANERADRPSVNSSGIDSRGSTASIGSRPSSILLSAGGESGLIGGRSSASSMQRPSTNSRPFSARPNAASISNGRPLTSSSLLIGGPLGSSAPPTAGGGGGGQIGGLYWRKNRVNAVDHSSAGSQNGRRGSAQDEDEEDAASSLTFGGEAALVGGGLARDLRRRRNNQQGGGGGGGGQMNRGPSPPSSQGSLLDALSRPLSFQGSKGGAHEGWVARRESSNEASTAPRQSNQENTGERIISISKSFDSEALLQELRRWKVETADVALMPAENEEGDGGGISGAWQITSDSQAEAAKADVLNFDTERSSQTFENPQVQVQSQDQSNRASSSDRIEVASGIKLSSINTTPILQGPSLRPSSALGRPPLSPVPSLLTSRPGSFKSLESNEEVKIFRPSTPSRNGLMMGLAPVLGARPARPSKMLLCKAILDAFPGRVVCKTTSSAAVWDQDGDQMDLIHSLSQKARSFRGGREVDLKSLNPMPAKRNEEQTAGDSGEWI